MIPTNHQLKHFETTTEPSLDYAMQISGQHVVGMCSGLEEIRQTIFCLLNTERYQYPIYSWNYGIELTDLYGYPSDYVQSQLQRRITEALRQDDRIESVDGFRLEKQGKEIRVFFTVHTCFGIIPAEKRWTNV